MDSATVIAPPLVPLSMANALMFAVPVALTPMVAAPMAAALMGACSRS